MQKTRLHGEQEGNGSEKDPEDMRGAMDELPRCLPLDAVAENDEGAGDGQGDIGEEQERHHREARGLDEECEPPPPDQRAFPPTGPNKQQNDTEDGGDRYVHGRYRWQINLHASARSGQGWRRSQF